MVMIFPLLLFFVFYFAAGFVLTAPAEGIQVVFGLAGIAAGFGINFLLNRKTDRKKLPEIINKIS